MKYFKITTLVLFVILALTSCDDNVYKKFDTNFSQNRWEKDDIKEFDFTIDTAGKYDLLVDFSHVYGSQFSSIPIKIAIQYPNSEIVNEPISLLLTDDDGNSTSDCTGDVCDFEQAYFANKQLNPGIYKVSISNDFEHIFLPNVLGLGIRVVASE